MQSLAAKSLAVLKMQNSLFSFFKIKKKNEPFPVTLTLKTVIQALACYSSCKIALLLKVWLQRVQQFTKYGANVVSEELNPFCDLDLEGSN